MRPVLRLLITICVWVSPVAVLAQSAATLVADRVLVSADQELIAEGNVEIFHAGTHLSASRITYSQARDRMVIDGPIFILGEDGTILTARQADLDPRLENGILRGARLVLDQQLQLGANQINRVDGRYSQLYQVAATSCHICGAQAPLWEIRARRVVHDETERQLYFDGAQFRVAGIPIAWVPRMRLPDPTLERATGLLAPRFRSTDQLGTGIKLPYFIRIGDHRDLTLTPYLSAETRTLETRYRQAYLRGDLELNLNVSNDSVRTNETRYYAQAQGQFDLARDYQLSFDLIGISDDGYLLDYDISSDDRLESVIALDRIDQNRAFHTSLTHIQSLRDSDDNSTLTSIVADLNYDRRLHPALIGGTLDLGFDGDSLYRYSDLDADGRDVTRFGAGADWHNSWIIPFGIVAEVNAGLRADLYAVHQDAAYEDALFRTQPRFHTTLRWPLAKITPFGATHLLEPVMQLAWSEAYGDTPPNEDSVLHEFDEANLLAQSRFAGEDAVETGWRGALGLRWTRTGPLGWHSTLTFGQIYHLQDQSNFSLSSGLNGMTSDLLIAGRLDFNNGLAVDLRTLVGDEDGRHKSQLRGFWSTDDLDLTAGYLFLPVDIDEDRDQAISEWTFDADYQINQIWSISTEARYDIVADRAAKAGIGIGWQNECVEVDLSVSRRFTSSTNVDPTTDIGLSVGLTGFSTGRAAGGITRSCGG